MINIDPKTNRHLKENVDVEEIFRIYLAQLISSKSDPQSSLIWSYKPTGLDKDTRSHLKARVKTAMASPESTSAYRFIMMGGQPNVSEPEALRYVKFRGFVVLALLGEKEIIPSLFKFMRENHKDIRARTIVSGVLLYLTGQDIGSYFLTEEDLDLWEEWWKKNSSTVA